MALELYRKILTARLLIVNTESHTESASDSVLAGTAQSGKIE